MKLGSTRILVLATAGTYNNTGIVNADDVLLGSGVTDNDDSDYYGVDPSVAIDKVTNGADGQNIASGSSITWTYTVTNTGNVSLDNVAVTDDQEGSATYQSGDTNSNSELDTNETWIYEIAGTAGTGAYNNTGTVTADDTLLSFKCK